MELKPLTKKQARVLEYVVAQVEAGYGPPTIREAGAKFNMSSTGSVRDVFKALRRKGYMVHARGKSRGNRLNPKIFEVKVKGKNKIKLKTAKRKKR